MAVQESKFPQTDDERSAFVEGLCKKCVRGKKSRGSESTGCDVLTKAEQVRVPEWVRDERGAYKCLSYVPPGERIQEKCWRTMDLFSQEAVTTQQGSR